MLPISAIVGVSTLGYLLDQAFRDNEFNENNENSPVPDVPSRDIDGCADQYPWNFVETFDNLNKNNENDINYGVPQDPTPLTPQYIEAPSSIHAKNNAGNPPADYLINATERPVEDFVVNNMVPFFRGTSTKQDMRGTGVAQANVLSEDFSLGNDNSTPHYTTLGTFTGFDDTYFHKREAPAFFSPLEQRDRFTIPGEDASAQRAERDRYTSSILYKNDEAPFERIQVGPGINVDAHMPNDGQGFNSGISTMIKPNNVNEYRLTQLPGRVSGTKYQASNLPTALPGIGPSFESFQNAKTNGEAWDITDEHGMIDSQKLINKGSLYGVNLKKQNIASIDTLKRRPLNATPAVTQAPMVYSNYVLPSATDKRTVTNVEFGQSIKVN
jgi:hypothetical protein